jgi:2-O-methyltransferase
MHEKLIAPYLPTNPVVIEAGAHVGTDTMAMAKLWKKGVIHAFEPVPDLYEKLVYNTRKFFNVRTYPYALGAKTGKQKMFVSSGRSDASSSLLKPKEHLNYHPEVYFETEIEVNVCPIDEWAKQNQVESVDFMWLDLQGNELEVLKNCPKTMTTVSTILLEINLVENYEGCALFEDFLRWFYHKGYRLQWFQAEAESFGNALFVKKQDYQG